MLKIKIMPIQDLLHLHALKDNEDILIIFVTTKPNYYDFGSTKFIQMNIADTEAPIIKREDACSLQRTIWAMQQCYRQYLYYVYNTVYVCCDAGLSRSPAVAHFLACKLNQFEQAEEIEKKYKFLNQALYKKLMGAM